MNRDVDKELKIFISYSRRDMAHLEYLQKYLVPLEQYASIKAWHDQRLKPADNWELELKKALDECDLALLLLSPDFLASEFINQRELPRLLERYELGQVVLLPIILRPSLWNLSPLCKFQALPKDGTPIITFSEEAGDRDRAWTNIAEEIANMAKNRPVPRAESAAQATATALSRGAGKPAHHPETRVCMFCELVGIDELRRHSSDEAVKRVTEYFAEMIARLPADQADHIDMSDTQSLLVFRSPSRAIAYALNLQQGASEMRKVFGDVVNLCIGIHQGEVLIGESARSGIASRHVNCASQVTQISDPGQIIITSSVFDSAQGGNFDTPKEFIAWLCLGDYYLSSVGTMELFEVADSRVRVPAPPKYKRTELPVNARRFELTNFKLGDRLGEGSSGIVYSAVQNSDNSRVAVKVLSGGSQANEVFLANFIKEVETVSRLSHESIVRVIEFHKETMPFYYVMDYVDGKPINQALEGADWDTIADTLIQLCVALQHAHDHGVLHGDLKPNNILVDAGGKPVVLDFGLGTLLEIDPARMEQSSTGTTRLPLYLAPEQIRETESVDYRADIYAVGVIMYQLLTGSLPYEGTFQAVREAHLSAVPALPIILNASVPEVLQRICLKAMEASRDRRYQNMQELESDLLRFKNREPVDTRPSMYDNLIEGPARKHVETINNWHKSRFITDKEHVALQRPYRRLLHTGLQAVSESRLVHLKVLVFYLGAWLVLAGCALWIMREWTEGLHLWRIAVAAIPAALANTYWHIFYKAGAHRLAFVGMIVGLLSLPFAVLTLTHDGAYELNASGCWLANNLELAGDSWFPADGVCPRAEPSTDPENASNHDFKISNIQALIALIIGVAWSAFVAYKSKTITSAMIAGSQITLLFIVLLDFVGFLADADETIFEIGALSILLTLILLAAAWAVSKPWGWGRPNQATPLFGLAMVVGIFATQAVAIDFPNSSIIPGSIDEIILRGVLEIICGLLYLATALVLYRRLRLESSAAYVVLLWLAPLAVLGGLTYISLEDGNENVFWLLFLSSVATLLYSARVQSFFYIVCGLGFTALSLYKIEDLLDTLFWPISLVATGAVLTLAIWFADKKSRKFDDMDDVSERIIKYSLTNHTAGHPNELNQQ